MALDRINATALLDGGVTTADIADDAVTTAKINAGAVDTTELADDAVTTAKLATQTGNVDFADGGRIRLGDSQDLQIYHNGNNSYIDDTGTGNLYIRGSDTVRLQSATGEQGVIVTTDGAVTLYHDNGSKLATTSTGVDVTGAIEADDKITIAYEAGSSDWELESTSGDDFTISRNGSQKLIIDGSTSNVGIGTNSPSELIHANGSTVSALLLTTNSYTSGTELRVQGDGSSYLYNRENAMLRLGTNNLERIRILSNGTVLMGKTSSDGSASAGFEFEPPGALSIAADGAPSVTINRNTNDGSLVAFRQANSTEGTISISGTTTSYNGGHISRWSRLLDNSKDTSIVKGTVMTNLDEMVEWGDEDNEQLNKMAVSSVEGDANVAGVFVNWDNDDDWNDMNVAMTGDMVIRIAQGTTIARGDLLMSAGDGTAKPQGDDIVRSKTIAKVTSTNVSHTYDDGTYLVPCVLMAC
jgi:hypothetical protein